MKDQFTDDFFTYIDTHMDRETVANELENSTKTLSSWKSIGIPKGKRFACQALMERHQAEQKPDAEEMSNVIVLRTTRDQFRRWNQAALDAGMLIEDWAFAALEEMADEIIAEHEAQKATRTALYHTPAAPASQEEEETA